MKLAIISVTKNGALLAEKLAKNLTFKTDLYAKVDRDADVPAEYYDSLSRLVDSIYNVYDGLIFIMATGIVVRVIAPHIRDKRFDPAVVVMDEAGEYAISLLAGHIGGANELARIISRAIDARPVITTATDVIQKPAADILAVKLGLEI
jgi:cobalt-precorrin 5A hydrolase